MNAEYRKRLMDGGKYEDETRPSPQDEDGRSLLRWRRCQSQDISMVPRSGFSLMTMECGSKVEAGTKIKILMK